MNTGINMYPAIYQRLNELSTSMMIRITVKMMNMYHSYIQHSNSSISF